MLIPRRSFLGGLLACGFSNLGAAEAELEPARRGRDFLAGLLDSELNLLPEYRGAKVYWLSHDNELAAKVLAGSHPKIGKAIETAIAREGLESSDRKMELFFGGRQDIFPFHTYELVDVRKVGDKVIRTERKTKQPTLYWENYTDLLFLASLAQGQTPEALKLWKKGMKTWDGKGFVDSATKTHLIYSTYKLALAIIAASHLSKTKEIPKELTNQLLAMQQDDGGWVTDYDTKGKRIGLANVETTCLAILGCEAV